MLCVDLNAILVMFCFVWLSARHIHNRISITNLALLT